MIIVMGIMISLSLMTTPTVLKLLRQSAVHSAAGDIIDAWNQARSLAMDRAVFSAPGSTLNYYGIEIVQQPGQAPYVGVIYDTKTSAQIAANPALSLLQNPTTDLPVAKFSFKQTIQIANGVGGPAVPLNGVLAIYVQYGSGYPIDPLAVASGHGAAASQVGLGIPGNPISNIPPSTISTQLQVQTIDYSPTPPIRGYAVSLALYPVGIMAEMH